MRVLFIAAVLVHESFFLDVCDRRLTPACTTYLVGFLSAMDAQESACFPIMPARIDMKAVRREAVRAAKEHDGSESVAILKAVAEMYPCRKEK